MQIDPNAGVIKFSLSSVSCQTFSQIRCRIFKNEMPLSPELSPLIESCPHRPPCPGCPRLGEPGVSPQAHSRLNEWAHAHALPDVAVESGVGRGFRSRARLAIRGRQNSPKVGLFELDSHRVVHIPNCGVHHPLINQVAGVVRRALVDARVTSYSDKAHLGIARYLQVVVERRSQAAQVVLVGNCPSDEPFAGCFELIRERLGDRLHSLWFNANTETGNVILGSNWRLIFGPESVVESFGGPGIYYPPGAFGQSNLDIAQKIIERVRDEIPPGARVAEFYAGVGAIGLSVLDLCSHLTMNEAGPQSLHGLDLGLARLNAEQRERISIAPGAAGNVCAIADNAQVVIVDPPRKGLDAQLCSQLQSSPPQKLIYISCGLESLLNDGGALTGPGKMQLTSLRAFNLMPYTDHVETMAVFERVHKK
jgi:23S rRNA (uracil1939-C5)-methyltransferase